MLMFYRMGTGDKKSLLKIRLLSKFKTDYFDSDRNFQFPFSSIVIFENDDNFDQLFMYADFLLRLNKIRPILRLTFFINRYVTKYHAFVHDRHIISWRLHFRKNIFLSLNFSYPIVCMTVKYFHIRLILFCLVFL